METETYAEEFISIPKGEGGEKNVRSVQLDATADECHSGELKNVEGALKYPPEYSEKTENMQVAKNIGIETASAVNKSNVGTSEGESFLESPSVFKVAREETGRVSEDHQTGEIPNQVNKEIFGEETKLQKYQKLESAEETSKVEIEGKEEIKEGEEKVAKEIPDEKNLPQVDLNVKIESQEVDNLNKNSHELLVSYPSTEEAVQVEGDKLDDISKFEPKEQVHETNEVSSEEKNFEEATEAYKSAKSLILEPTSTEGEKVSNTYNEAIDYGLDTEKGLKQKHAGQNIEEEMQKKEEACDPEIHESGTKSIDTGKGKIDEEISTKVSDTTDIENETIQRRVDYLHEEPSALTSEGKSNQAEDDAEKDNIIPEEVHDEIKITGTMEVTRELIGRVDVTEGLPESIREETVKIFPDNEKVFLADEKSRGDNEEQIIADNVKGRPESIKEENFTENENQDEKCREEIFESSEMARAGECVENEKIFDISMVKPKESLLSEDENEIPIDASTEEKRDEQRYSVMDEDNDDNTGLVEVKYGGKDETSMVKENKGWSSKKDATEEKHEQFSNVLSKVPEAVKSSEYTEKITCIEEERAIQDIKVNSEKVDREDTRDSEGRVTASGEDLKPVVMVSERNKSTGSTDLELKSEKGEMEVEKLERGNELGSEERFEGHNAREETEEEIKKEETSDADLHKVEITCDDTEKIKIEEDVLIKDGSTVLIGEEIVDLRCQEDKYGQTGGGKEALQLNGEDHNGRTDNETESSTDQIISKEIAANSQGTEKHTIKEEQSTIDISPQSSGEDMHKSSQEGGTKEEEPKMEMCEELEITTECEGIEGQLSEGDTIQHNSTEPTEVDETEDISKDNITIAKMPKPEVNMTMQVSETSAACNNHSTEFIEKETEIPHKDKVCKESKMAVTSMEIGKQENAISDLSFSTFGGEIVKDSSDQGFVGSIKECDEVEKVEVELEIDAECIGSEPSDTIKKSGLIEENKTSVDPGEKLEGEPESVERDQTNETLPKMNQTQIKENSDNVQDQKSESVVEEHNIEQGLQEDEKNTYEETTSRLDARDHMHEVQNTNETISQRTVDISDSIFEVSEENIKEIIQEAKTCYVKLDTASKKVEAEEISSREAQPDEKPMKGTESSQEEKTVIVAETSPQSEEGESIGLEETTEFMSQLPDIPGENADNESGTVESLHVDEVEETKGDVETVSESKEQRSEEIDGTQKNLTVEELEGIIKEESKGPSETVSGCNYQLLEAVIQDEINVVETATTGKSEEKHQETSDPLLSKEQNDGSLATIGCSEDGKAEKGETTQNENLEDSLTTKTSENICLHKEEPRELEISELGIKVSENIQNINPNEPPKEECSTLDEVSQIEPQENVAAIKFSDSQQDDRVKELSEEVLEGAEKAAEENEDIKEQITEKYRDIEECVAVSLGDESVNKVQHSETISDENPRAADSEVQIEKVNLEVTKGFSQGREGSPVTKAMEQEMLQKQGSEERVEVSSSVSEVAEEINMEVIEDTNICFNNIDTTSEKVETDETRLREAQLEDKHIKITETSPDKKTLQLQTNTTETSPQTEEVDSVKLEETPEGVSQCPVIACENTVKESEIVGNPHVDDGEEIKGASESVSESREQHVEENNGTQESLIVIKSDEGITKEDIKGSSETGSSCNHQGVNVVIEEEIDVVHTTTEVQHQEASKALLSEEQDHGITTTIGHLEDGKAEKGETPQNENLEDSFAIGTTEEICLQKEEPRELENFRLGLELNENTQNVNPNGTPIEECIMPDEVSKVEPQEHVSTVKCSASPTESDKVMELSEEVPEEAAKAAEESENIKELIIEKERDVKECPAVFTEDESVRRVEYSETVSDENTRAADSEGQTEKANQEAVEDFSKDSEGSLTTKAMEEGMLQKQGSGKEVDIPSSVSEISQDINEEVIKDVDACSNNIDTAPEKVETEETRLWEAQLDGEHTKITETSSEDKIKQTNITIETSAQGEKVDNTKLEETPERESQLPAIVCEETDESENVVKPHADEFEETKGASDIVSESREQSSEENDGIQKSLTVDESESIIEEEIRESSITVSGCNYEGVEAVIEDEINVAQIATITKSEEQHQETSKALLSAEQDCGIITTTGYSEDGKTVEVEIPQEENPEDPFETKTTEVIEGVEKAAEENEDIKDLIIEERGGDESVNKVLHSEIVSDENARATDSEVTTENVNLQVVEVSSKDLEGSPVTKALEEEMLQKQDSEKKIEVSSSVSERSEEINNEVVEDADTCSNNIDTASDKVETEDTSLQVGQLKDIKIIKTSSEAMIQQTDITTETSPLSEEVDRITLEETSEVVSQLPAIVCENKDESETVEKSNTDEVEEIKGASDTVYECKEQCVEEIDETQKSLIMEDPEIGVIKDEIKGPSDRVSGCNYEGIGIVIEDEINVVQAATTGKSEESHHEASTVLFFEEQNRGITTTIGYSEDEMPKEDETPQKEGPEDSFSTKTEEVCLLKKEAGELEISGLGLEDVQKNKANELQKEESSTPDEVLQLEPRENVSEIKCTDYSVEGDKITELARSIDSTLQQALKDDENLDSRISNNKADDDLLPNLAGEEILQKGNNICDKTSDIECEKIEKASSNVLKTIDSQTEEVLEDCEKDAESENIKKQIIEKEAESAEPAALSIDDDLANKVQHPDIVPSENLGATDPNIQTEKVNLDVLEDLSQDLEGTPFEKALEEEKPKIQCSEKTVEISSFVSEISEGTDKEVIEDTDACHGKLDTTYEKVETEETSLQDAQLNDNHIKIIETSSEDKKLQTNTSIETSPQGEGVDGVKLEVTSALVSQLLSILCENADKEGETVEKPTRDEVEETKGASDIDSDYKEQQFQAMDETQKNPTVEESKDVFTEEIKGPSETESQSKYQGVEAIIEEKITAAETTIAGKSEKQHQETTAALLYEEQDHGISTTVGYSEDGKTKEDEILQPETLRDSFASKIADCMHLKKEEQRQLEISGLGKGFNENPQKNNLDGAPKEGCSTIDDVSPLDPQGNVSLLKCTNSPVESYKVMELTKEVPEVAEKAVERENIVELIIEKEREIKEQPAVSIDESVIKVQVLEPVSSENLGVADSNMPTENLNLEVEDLRKEPEGSPDTKALEEETSEKQNDQKPMDIPGSVSEMNEIFKEEIMERADISNDKLDTESEKGETEESSLQEAELDDKPLEIIETCSEDKILQTHTTTRTSQQAEEVDCMKLKETLESASQLPANVCESINKESKTVEKPNAEEIEETTGDSDTVIESKEQCAEEIDENQKSIALEKSEEDIIKEQFKGVSEMYSESKYQGVESVIEEEIIAGQAIEAGKPEEQLEEVPTSILSEEQEHEIHTIIGKLEDENIKEGETQQYKNLEDSSKTSEEVCLQKEERGELDISGLGPEINEDAPKEDGNSVDGVSQNELQENASELKCTDFPLGSETVIEQTRSTCSTQQDATKDDENLDSGIVNDSPDVLAHSPGGEILQEVGEKCEEASNLECENFEKASESVPNLDNAANDEEVAGSEVGAHVHESDASNTQNSENLIEEVPQGAEEAVEGENIKELIIEKERDVKDLPAVPIEDGTVNKVQHAEAVPNENLTSIDSNTQTEIMNSEVAEDLSKVPEGSPISEALQQEISQKQTGDKTEEVTISVSEMSEGSFSEEIIKLAPEKVVIEETSLQEVQLDEKPQGLDTGSAEKTLSTNTRTESSPQGEEAESLKVEETSELMSQLPTIACERAEKDSKTVEAPHADVEEPKGPSDTVSESRKPCVENFLETRESLTLEKSEEILIKEEIKGPSDGVSECINQSFEAVIENKITADQTREPEKSEEQVLEMSTALVSEDQEHGISTITTKLEDEKTVEDETPQYENPQESCSTRMTEERCLHNEESRDLEDYKLELNNDVEKKTSNEESKEGGNALYGITPPEPQEDALEIKCRDSLAESDMELTRSMDSILQDASKGDEDWDSGISTKNVSDVLPLHSYGEEILQEVDGNGAEASNLEGEIEKASESTFQVQSAEVDKVEIELEAGSHSHGSEPPSTGNNNNLTEKNIELAELGKKLEGGPELVADDQCIETNQTQANENRSSAWKQNTKSIGEQLPGQELQEHEKETIEETEGKLESGDHINAIQNENETTKDLISVVEVSKEAEVDEEKENIQQHTIEEKRDVKELAAVSIEDETVNKVQHSENETTKDVISVVEVSKKAEIAEEKENIQEQLIEEKRDVEELAEVSIEDKTVNKVQHSENETINDVILVVEVSKEAEIAEEKENIQEQIIEEKRDVKELAAVSIEDETVIKEQHSELVSCESFSTTESSQETKEVNLQDEEDPCEKQADASSSVFELSEKEVKGDILDEADTASEMVEAEEIILQEPQLDDETKSIETILEENTLLIINTTETTLGDEEPKAVKLEKTPDLVSQLPTTAYEQADERVIVEKQRADEVEETKRASDAVSESKDHCVEEIDEAQRSQTKEKLEEEIIEGEITGGTGTVSACNQGVEAIFQDEITRVSLEAGNSEEQLQEMSTALLPEEDHEIATTIGESEVEDKREHKTPQKKNLEDYLGTECVGEICLQKEGLRELEVSALAPKLRDVIQKETPNEVLKVKGRPQENVSERKYMDSITGTEEVMELTRSINSSSQEASREEEILDSGSSNNKADDFSITYSSREISQQMQEQWERTPNLESKKIEEASESVSEVHHPEVIIKLEEPEVKEEHPKTSVTEMKTEQTPHEKAIESNEVLQNEILNAEIAEEKKVAKNYQPESLEKETIRKSHQGDKLKNEAEHEFSEGSKKGEASENIEKQIIDEPRTVKHPHLVSFRDESVNGNLPEEAEERNNKETDIKLDLVNQSDETALTEQLMKKDPNVADADDDKEIVITKDEDLKANLDVQPATSAAAKESSHWKEGDRIREVSESVPQELVHEATRRNEEIAAASIGHSENIMDDKMHTHMPHDLACHEHDVSEGLNLKDPEVNTNENGTLPLPETSWEEVLDKESLISEEERQHDLTSGKQTIATTSSPTDGKGAKDEVAHAKDEEPIGFSARGREGRLEKAEIHSTPCNKDGEIQDQIDKLTASSHVQVSCMEMSEKEVNLDFTDAKESTQHITDKTSQQCIPREAEPNEEVQLVPQDLLRETLQQPDLGSQESVNVSRIESGEKDLGGEKTMGDISEELAVDPAPMGPAASLSDLFQRSVRETLQTAVCLAEETQPMVNKEDVLAKEELNAQEAGTHEDKDEEEDGDEHGKDDSGSDAPIIVEASKDMNVKDGHKKSHNILSGVGSKVKHSIAKVKKAITGKSSHQKHSSPKGTATKVKEQK